MVVTTTRSPRMAASTSSASRSVIIGRHSAQQEHRRPRLLRREPARNAGARSAAAVERVEPRVRQLPRPHDRLGERRAVVGRLAVAVRLPAPHADEQLQRQLQVVDDVPHRVAGLEEAGTLDRDQRPRPAEHQPGRDRRPPRPRGRADERAAVGEARRAASQVPRWLSGIQTTWVNPADSIARTTVGPSSMAASPESSLGVDIRSGPPDQPCGRPTGRLPSRVHGRNLRVAVPPARPSGRRPPAAAVRPRCGGRYPVLYLQDGQNLFDPSTAFGGVPWRCDETADRLTRRALFAGHPRRRREHARPAPRVRPPRAAAPGRLVP